MSNREHPAVTKYRADFADFFAARAAERRAAIAKNPNHIRERDLALGWAKPVPAEPTEAEIKAMNVERLQREVREYLADLQTIARIKMDCNPLFAPHGLHLVRLPNWGRA